MAIAKLILEDGSEFSGTSFGFEKSVAGEMVFNTAMTGYPESLTDPSYKGQLLVATYPLIGNYGVPGRNIEHELLRNYESDRIHVSGLIISHYSKNYSHWNADHSLSKWLCDHEIPGIFGIDTRALTKKLREFGSMPGKLIISEEETDWVDSNVLDLVSLVTTPERTVYGEGKYKVLLVDCGVKNNIIRCLLRRDTTVIRVPYDYDFLNEEYDGLFISNGPGDPKMNKKTIHFLRKALAHNKPIFGICLGTQLLALAAGSDTYKLKYGHRSHNQPVLQVGTNRCYITSQNHGYVIDTKTLPDDWEEYFVNANDGTCEGIRHRTKPFFTTQFHPEASSGPVDTEFLFDEFVEMMKRAKN